MVGQRESAKAVLPPVVLGPGTAASGVAADAAPGATNAPMIDITARFAIEVDRVARGCLAISRARRFAKRDHYI